MDLLLLVQFQTTAPKSCYMRPPGGILAPGESLIATGNFLICNFSIHVVSYFFPYVYVSFLIWCSLSVQVCGAT